MNSVIETLFLRRPKIDYISPPICDVDFSASGSPVIILDAIGRRRGPTGLILSGAGTPVRLSWDAYPGALCYTVYKAVDALDPFGDYQIVAECITDNFIDLDDPGVYRVTVVTRDGESDPSNPVTITNVVPPPQVTIEVVNLNPLNMLAEDGTLVGVLIGLNRPGIHSGGVTTDLSTETDSAPITASQLTNTVTASDSIFSASDVGKFIIFDTSEEAEITGFVSPLQVTVTPSQSVASTTFLIRGNTLGGGSGNATLCNANGIVAGEEAIFGGGSTDSFWLDREAGEIRNVESFNDSFGFPQSINENGYILFQHNTGAFISGRLYDPNTQTAQTLGSIDGNGGFASPKGLNNNLQCAVAANTLDSGATTWVKAARWESGVYTDLHSNALAGENDDTVKGINSQGSVFGSYFTDPGFVERGFLSTGGGIYFDIGGIGSAPVSPSAMNNLDQITGTADDGGGNFRPFLYDGSFSFIPLLDGTVGGNGRDINNLGEIVGKMDSKCFLYSNGVTYDLYSLLPASAIAAGWTSLSFALFINDARQVAGFGVYNGNFVGYLINLV